MTGFLLLFVMAIWLLIACWFTYFSTKKIPKCWWRTPVRILLFFAILPSPLIDEIVGGRQFDQLCKDNSTIQVDRKSVRGKTVYLAELPDVWINGTWVPIRLQPWRFVDVTTTESAISYNILHATGGIFIRALGISEGNAPLTFKSSCEPDGVGDPLKLFKELGVTQVQRSTLNIEEQK